MMQAVKGAQKYFGAFAKSENNLRSWKFKRLENYDHCFRNVIKCNIKLFTSEITCWFAENEGGSCFEIQF